MADDTRMFTGFRGGTRAGIAAVARVGVGEATGRLLVDGRRTTSPELRRSGRGGVTRAVERDRGVCGARDRAPPADGCAVGGGRFLDGAERDRAARAAEATDGVSDRP